MHQRQHRQTSAALETASDARCAKCLRPGGDLAEVVIVIGLTELAPRPLCARCIAEADDQSDPWLHLEILDGRRASAA